MNILHLIDSAGMYGAETMLLSLVHEQYKLGLNPIIASIGAPNVADKAIEIEAKARHYRVKIFRMRPGFNIFGISEILSFSKKSKIDIFHSHGYKANILLGFLPKRLLRKPLISTLHGYTSTKGLSRMRFYEILDGLSHNFMDQVVLVNDAMRYHPILKKRIGYKTVNNGIACDSSEFSENKTTGQADQAILKFCNGFTIGSIGRLSPEKNYPVLIQAVSLLREQNFNARLVIIGEGRERKKLETMVSDLSLQEHVLMPGYYQNAKKFMGLFNAYIIPSLTEGLPITLLEAMYAKIPIIATRVGGISEVLMEGKAGILLNSPAEPNQIVHAVLQVHENIGMTKNMITKAHQRVISDYSSRKMALQYLQIYKDSAIAA